MSINPNDQDVSFIKEFEKNRANKKSKKTIKLKRTLILGDVKIEFNEEVEIEGGVKI
jgi:hypothetical protein